MGTDKRERQKELRRQRLEEEARAYRRQRRNRRLVGFGIIVFVALLAVVAVSALVDEGDDGDGGDEQAADGESPTTAPTTAPGGSTTTAPPQPYGTGECPPVEGVTEPVLELSDRPQQCIDPARTYTAVFDTSEGEIRVELDTETTPATANNFAVLSRYGYYDGTLLHRTDPSIGIIQGGSPHTNDASDPGPGYTIVDEGSGYTYEPGQLVMARTPAPNSAGAQFFFVADAAASALDADGSYVVFGNVTQGMDVVEQILALHEPDPESGLGGAPSRDVVVNQVRIEES